MNDTPQLLLAHHLKILKLPTFLRDYDKVAKQCAAEGIDHARYLLRLAELELIDRERRMVERRIKAARFPATKSLDSFDFKAIPSLNKMMVLETGPRRLHHPPGEHHRRSVTQAPARPTSRWGLGLAACQKGPDRRLHHRISPGPWNCWRPATRSAFCACRSSSPNTGC